MDRAQRPRLYRRADVGKVAARVGGEVVDAVGGAGGEVVDEVAAGDPVGGGSRSRKEPAGFLVGGAACAQAAHVSAWHGKDAIHAP